MRCGVPVVSALFVALASSAWGASLTLQGSGTASDATGPIIAEVGGQPARAFRSVDSVSLEATSIDGFASLAAVSPSSVELSFGELELIEATIGQGFAVTRYGDTDQSPNYLALTGPAGILAFGSVESFEILFDTNPASPGFLTATAEATLQLFGPAPSAFFQEVLALSGHSGVAVVTISRFEASSFGDPATFALEGAFMPVPECSAAAGLSVAWVALLAMAARSPAPARERFARTRV